MVTEFIACLACGRKNASHRTTCLSCGADLPISNASKQKQVSPPWAVSLWQQMRNDFEFIWSEKWAYVWVVFLICAFAFSVSKITATGWWVIIAIACFALLPLAEREIRRRRELFDQGNWLEGLREATVECPRCFRKSLVLSFYPVDGEEIEIENADLRGTKQEKEFEYVIEVSGYRITFYCPGCLHKKKIVPLKKVYWKGPGRLFMRCSQCDNLTFINEQLYDDERNMYLLSLCTKCGHNSPWAGLRVKSNGERVPIRKLPQN